MKHWPPRIREDLVDDSAKAGVAGLLEALETTRRERDSARREAALLRRRLDVAQRHLRLRIARPKRRRKVVAEGQLRLDLGHHENTR